MSQLKLIKIKNKTTKIMPLIPSFGYNDLFRYNIQLLIYLYNFGVIDTLTLGKLGTNFGLQYMTFVGEKIASQTMDPNMVPKPSIFLSPFESLLLAVRFVAAAPTKEERILRATYVGVNVAASAVALYSSYGQNLTAAANAVVASNFISEVSQNTTRMHGKAFFISPSIRLPKKRLIYQPVMVPHRKLIYETVMVPKSRLVDQTRMVAQSPLIRIRQRIISVTSVFRDSSLVAIRFKKSVLSLPDRFLQSLRFVRYPVLFITSPGRLKYLCKGKRISLVSTAKFRKSLLLDLVFIGGLCFVVLITSCIFLIRKKRINASKQRRRIILSKDIEFLAIAIIFLSQKNISLLSVNSPKLTN
jgi:hypothetical protein